MSDNREGTNGGSMYANIKQLARLQIDYARLTVAEKVSLMLSTMAVWAIVVIFSTLTFVFLTLGAGHLLATTIAPHFAYMFVAAFYALILVLLIIFRKPLFISPIARFTSKIFVKPPTQEGHEKE